MYVSSLFLQEVLEPLLFSKQNEQHFRFSKLEHLWWIDNGMDDHKIDSLFCFLKFCPSLKRLFITVSFLYAMYHFKPICLF